ncbi:2,3-diaminopropionate biosynthesis protein SbnB [Streptomyces sp. NPDC057677]|uniref:2,3-diaminopropionate biosynthesis protein SbnB n=1 Tax=unclassified Streptomyces TaxID=2593676 RepID=UPI0036C21C0A
MNAVQPLSDRTRPVEAVSVPPFAVVPGRQVKQVLDGREPTVRDIVESAYHLHSAGRTVNPASTFLRFPDRSTARIIALPASLAGDSRVDGLKWISSFPENVRSGIPRASAVLILNDPATGYPVACMESSVISAARTAASAAAAADWLSRGRPRAGRIGFIGTGLIARYIHTYLRRTGWSFTDIGLHDRSHESAAGFRLYLEQSGADGDITVHTDPEQLVRTSDLLVFATVAATPHINAPSWFDHHPVVLHVSLRDLAPPVLLSATNIVDDPDHCLRAQTSPHLTERLTGNRDFVHGTLADVMAGRVSVPPDATVVFSPFGLGVLDLAVGKYVYDRLAQSGELAIVEDFFDELGRFG